LVIHRQRAISPIKAARLAPLPFVILSLCLHTYVSLYWNIKPFDLGRTGALSVKEQRHLHTLLRCGTDLSKPT
jgi:hypothetical protein